MQPRCPKKRCCSFRLSKVRDRLHRLASFKKQVAIPLQRGAARVRSSATIYYVFFKSADLSGGIDTFQESWNSPRQVRHFLTSSIRERRQRRPKVPLRERPQAATLSFWPMRMGHARVLDTRSHDLLTTVFVGRFKCMPRSHSGQWKWTTLAFWTTEATTRW